MNYSNKIIDGKLSVWLQDCGWCPAKPAKEFQSGEFMRWNTGSETKVVEIVRQTEKTITYKLEWKDAGGNYESAERKLFSDRWIAIGTGKNYYPSTGTPLMPQYYEIKTRYPDAILLFRVGDFYEAFGPDAVTIAKELGLTLTKGNNPEALKNNMAGFAYSGRDAYLHKLVKAGYRVAICDQLEDPK
jgi:hypothetical protein